MRGAGDKAPSTPVPDPCLFFGPGHSAGECKQACFHQTDTSGFERCVKTGVNGPGSLCLLMVQSSNDDGVQIQMGLSHISTFKGSLFSPPQIYPLHSEGKYIYTLVFIGRPAGITGLMAIDHVTEVVSPLGEITYSSE